MQFFSHHNPYILQILKHSEKEFLNVFVLRKSHVSFFFLPMLSEGVMLEEQIVPLGSTLGKCLFQECPTP
jgi:hypothetical protein